MRKFFFFLLLVTGQAIAQDTLLLISGRTILASSVDLKDNTIAYRKDDKLKTINSERVFSVLFHDGTEHVVYQPDSLDPIDFKVNEMRNFIQGERDARRLYRNNVVKIAGIGVGVGSSALFNFYGIIGPPLYATIIQQLPSNVERVLSIKVNGNGAGDLGIAPGKYVNETTGNPSSGMKMNDKLQICNKTFRATKDLSLDETADLINTRKECTGVSAKNESGRLRLFKTTSGSLINDNAYREGFEKRVREYKVRSAWITGLIGFVAGSITFSIIANNN